MFMECTVDVKICFGWTYQFCRPQGFMHRYGVYPTMSISVSMLCGLRAGVKTTIDLVYYNLHKSSITA